MTTTERERLLRTDAKRPTCVTCNLNGHCNIQKAISGYVFDPMLMQFGCTEHEPALLDAEVALARVREWAEMWAREKDTYSRWDEAAKEVLALLQPSTPERTEET